MQADAFAFFTKPFDHTQFLAAVRDAFGHISPDKKLARMVDERSVALETKSSGCAVRRFMS
jgi:hypothetical protein